MSGLNEVPAGACHIDSWPRHGSGNGPEGATTFTSPNTRAAALEQLDIAGLIRDGIPPVEFDVADLLVRQNYAIMSAAAKDFKTFIAIAQAICLVSRKDFAGMKTTAPEGGHRVLFMECESTYQIAPRVKALCRGLDVDPFEVLKGITFWSPKGRLDLHRNDHVREVLQRIDDGGITMTMIDSFVRIHTLDENSSRDMNSLAQNALRPMVEEGGSSLVVLDHIPKGKRWGKEQIRGSGEKLAAADTHLDVDAHRSASGVIVTLSIEAQRNAPEHPGQMHIELVALPDGGLRFEPCGPPERKKSGPKATTRSRCVVLFRKLPAGTTRAGAVAAAKEEGIGRQTAYNVWSDLHQGQA